MLGDKLISTAKQAPGYGVAAVQVGLPLRMFSLYPDAGGENTGIDPFVVINPEITDKGSDGEVTISEGVASASCPGIFINITRPSI